MYLSNLNQWSGFQFGLYFYLQDGGVTSGELADRGDEDDAQTAGTTKAPAKKKIKRKKTKYMKEFQVWRD